MRKTTVDISKVLIFVFIMILSEIHLMSSGWSLSPSPFFLSFLFINQPNKQTNKKPKTTNKKMLIKSLNFRDC